MDFNKLINNIKRNFSEERLHQSKKRLEKVWKLEIPEDRIPFVFSKVPDESGVNDDRLYESGYDIEEYLYYQLYQIQKRAILNDDYIPSFFPGLRQSAIPSAFGANEEKQGEHYWSRPIIKKPEDVYKLKEPNFNKKGSAAWRILENIKYCRKMIKGNLPIHMADMQGPMACASTIWDVNDYLIAMYDNPDEVHHLHNILTKAFIEFIDLQVEASEGDFVPIHAMPFAWMPKEMGISLSNDLLAMVTPCQLEEFSNPYDSQIAAYYNGILIHSCGNFNYNLSALKKVNNLRAINFGSTETDIKDIIKIFSNSVLYIPHSTEVAVFPMKVETQEDFIKRISRIIKENSLAAQVLIITPAGYSLDQVLELNSFALNELKYM
jgi:hypothetical protein